MIIRTARYGKGKGQVVGGVQSDRLVTREILDRAEALAEVFEGTSRAGEIAAT
ncbi:hypothetical protein ACFWAY_47660 [Rhodococcus sp. NPDC059968]|uniref:hypothetical protein n=1 Tax=Rhodococcus sp. NPDC059968 TaxID=3347017 RepID=UPI00366C6EF8